MTVSLDTIHVVEPGGQGGVYQHVLGAVQAGQFDDFRRIVLHTARDAELLPKVNGLVFCRCMRYQRRGARIIRASVSLSWVLFVMLPHLIKVASKANGSWEIQGLFGKGIYAMLVAIPRSFRRDVTFVPHNSFSRSGSRIERIALQVATSLADRTIVFVQSERDKFPAAKAVVVRRLWQYVVPMDQSAVKRWRSKFSGEAANPVILFVGQLRMDKNPVLLLDAVNTIDRPMAVVFAGQDKGALRDISSHGLKSLHRRIVISDYLKIDDFQAIILASDVIVCPYSVASQSGVVALAVQLGKPVVASNVGGLAEQTDFTFDVFADNADSELAAILRHVVG